MISAQQSMIDHEMHRECTYGSTCALTGLYTGRDLNQWQISIMSFAGLDLPAITES